jgi:transcriptional regulator with XRE-family HTH domain
MIGERLKALRKRKKITQEELADILGVRKSSVSLYETNKADPSDPIKIIIAKYFKISLDYLIGVIDEEVGYYDTDLFIKLPDNFSETDKIFLNKYIEFAEYTDKNP